MNFETLSDEFSPGCPPGSEGPGSSERVDRGPRSPASGSEKNETGEKRRKKIQSPGYGVSECAENDPSQSSAPRYWPETRESMINRLKQRGDDADWAEFVGLYGPLILRFCRRRLGPEDAEEVSQIALLRVFRGLNKFQYSQSRGRFGGWVGQITRNEIARYLLRSLRQNFATDGLDLEDILTGTARGEWEDDYQEWLVEQALKRTRLSVTAEQWELFQLTWAENRTPAEVAAEKGIESTKVHKSRFVVASILKDHVRELAQDYISPDGGGGERLGSTE